MLGKFIVIEGLEGAGKTTAIKTVKKTLFNHHIENILFTREPGSTVVAEALRDLIKNPPNNEHLTNKAELLLFYAARIQLIETVIKPALKAGTWVVGDRHDLSTQAYQGGGRQLDKHFMQILKEQILADFKPDLTLYLDIDPKVGLMRAHRRGALDRIEQESLTFFNRIRSRYKELAADDPTIITINAMQPIKKVTMEIEQILSDWLQRVKD